MGALSIFEAVLAWPLSPGPTGHCDMARKAAPYMNKSLNLLGCQFTYQKRMALVVGGIGWHGVQMCEAVRESSRAGQCRRTSRSVARGKRVCPRAGGRKGSLCTDVTGRPALVLRCPDGHSGTKEVIRQRRQATPSRRVDRGLRRCRNPSEQTGSASAGRPEAGRMSSGACGLLVAVHAAMGAGWAVLCVRLQVGCV